MNERNKVGVGRVWALGLFLGLLAYALPAHAVQTTGPDTCSSGFHRSCALNSAHVMHCQCLKNAPPPVVLNDCKQTVKCGPGFLSSEAECSERSGPGGSKCYTEVTLDGLTAVCQKLDKGGAVLIQSTGRCLKIPGRR
jgi:hypothetical protein